MVNPFKVARRQFKLAENWLRGVWQRIPKSTFKVFAKPSVILVFVLVTLWNVLISGRFLDHQVPSSRPIFKAVMDTARDLRDTNLNLQMRLYQPISHRAIPLRDDKVSIVYINDDVHWNKMYGNIPTDRKELAKIILHAAQSRTAAAAIGLDVELLMPPGGQDDPVRTQKPPELPKPSPTSGKPPRQPCLEHGVPSPGTDSQLVPYLLDCDTPSLEGLSDDDSLLAAIKFAQRNGTPVILASVLYNDHGQHQLPNLYTLHELGLDGCMGMECSGYGYINLPEDKRQVPITEAIEDSAAHAPQVAESFAYKIAKAAANNPEPLLDDPADAIPSTEVFGTFLPERAFKNNEIDFVSLSNGLPDAEQKCRRRIVLIGGHWHEAEGYGEPVDQHLSPAGDISGVALHATYIEALMARQISPEWSFTTNFCLDIGLGLVIFYVFESIKEPRRKVKYLALWCLVPVAGAWISMAAWNKYLDFLFPVELYFLHILITLWEHRFHKKAASSSAPATS